MKTSFAEAHLKNEKDVLAIRLFIVAVLTQGRRRYFAEIAFNTDREKRGLKNKELRMITGKQ